jgi:hypothetical protein
MKATKAFKNRKGCRRYHRGIAGRLTEVRNRCKQENFYLGLRQKNVAYGYKDRKRESGDGFVTSWFSCRLKLKLYMSSIVHKSKVCYRFKFLKLRGIK